MEAKRRNLKEQCSFNCSSKSAQQMAKQPAKKQETTKPTSKKLTGTRVISKTKASLPFSAHNRKSMVIGAIFLATGIITLLLSIRVNSQVIALIGLGITFWGALFILVTPARYVEGSLLTSTAIATYLTVDRIIGEFKHSAKACYLPPYSQEEHLPEHLKGLKETVAFVSAKKNSTMPRIEELAQSKFMLTNKKGVLLTPPGLGLLTETEKNLPQTTKITISELCELVPKIMLENFALAKDITMQAEADNVNLTIRNSIYMNLYSPENNLKSISLLGCPIVSAIACAIAKTAGKAVTIQNIEFSSEDLTTKIEFQLVKE
jgi:hypothetical protein